MVVDTAVSEIREILDTFSSDIRRLDLVAEYQPEQAKEAVLEEICQLERGLTRLRNLAEKS